jgi:hypothetical protein
MKKSIFIAVLGAVSAGAAYGQGYVNFSNYYDPHQTTGITYASGPNVGLGVGNEISVELLYGPASDNLVSQLTPLASSITPVGWNGVTSPAPLGTAFTSYAGAGVFNAGGVLVPGTPGSSYAFALYAFGGGYAGYSSIFVGASQGNGVPLPTVPSLPLGLEQQTFTVAPVPEPTTLALGGMGLAALLLYRRKQA